MMCTASAATSAGPTTRRMGSVARSCCAAVVELVAEERCRQRRVDEAGGDEVDPHGRELEREVGGEGGERGGDRRREPEADAGAAGAGAAHEQQRASRSHLARRRARATWSDQQEVLVEGAARLREVHVERGARRSAGPP